MWEHLILRWVHVLLVAYWLGGEWGVFHTSRNVVNEKLDINERRRFLATALDIDIAPRTAIVMLLPVGAHMAINLGALPLERFWLFPIWGAAIAWVSLVWYTYAKRADRPLYRKLNRYDDYVRFVLIPTLIGVGGFSLLSGGPIEVRWFATKLFIFGLLLIIGLLLRWTVAVWVEGFRRLDTEGSNPEVEGLFQRSMAKARIYAYCYWVLIATMAFIGISKPF